MAGQSGTSTRANDALIWDGGAFFRTHDPVCKAATNSTNETPSNAAEVPSAA